MREAPADQAASVLQRLYRGLGRDAARALVPEIVERRGDGIALYVVGDEARLARDIVRGGRRLREKPELASRLQDRSAATAGYLGAETPGSLTAEQAAALAPIREATTALYATRREAAPGTDFDADLCKAALSDVVEAVVAASDGPPPAPLPGMKPRAFDRALATLHELDFGRADTAVGLPLDAPSRGPDSGFGAPNVTPPADQAPPIPGTSGAEGDGAAVDADPTVSASIDAGLLGEEGADALIGDGGESDTLAVGDATGSAPATASTPRIQQSAVELAIVKPEHDGGVLKPKDLLPHPSQLMPGIAYKLWGGKVGVYYRKSDREGVERGFVLFEGKAGGDGAGGGTPPRVYTIDEAYGRFPPEPVEARDPDSDIAPPEGLIDPSHVLVDGDGKHSVAPDHVVRDAGLMNDQWTHIPSVWNGRPVSKEEAIEAAVASGKDYPTYDDPQQAESAADNRLEMLNEGLSNSAGHAAARAAWVRKGVEGSLTNPTHLPNLKDQDSLVRGVAYRLGNGEIGVWDDMRHHFIIWEGEIFASRSDAFEPARHVSIDEAFDLKQAPEALSSRPVASVSDPRSIEMTIVRHPLLNNYFPTLVPAFRNGRRLTRTEAAEAAVASGEQYRGYSTWAEAQKALVKRMGPGNLAKLLANLGIKWNSGLLYWNFVRVLGFDKSIADLEREKATIQRVLWSPENTHWEGDIEHLGNLKKRLEFIERQSASRQRAFSDNVREIAENEAVIAAVYRNPIAEKAVKAVKDMNLGDFWDALEQDYEAVLTRLLFAYLEENAPNLVGGLVAGVAGAGIAGGFAEFGSSVFEKLKELGADFNDSESVHRVLTEHKSEIWDHASSEAAKAGLWKATVKGAIKYGPLGLKAALKPRGNGRAGLPGSGDGLVQRR